MRFVEHRSIKLFNSRTIRRSIDKIVRRQEEAALLKGGQSSAEHPANVHRLRYRWPNWWAKQPGQLSDRLEHIHAWIQMASQVGHVKSGMH